VYINNVIVHTSKERSKDFAVEADFPEIPTKNEITIKLVDASTNREIERVRPPAHPNLL
jgi:hypothetical protein